MLNFNVDYPDWHSTAACFTNPKVDPAWFFCDKGSRSFKAKQICNGDPKAHIPPCPVKDTCLKWILDFDKNQGFTSPGTYGGLGFKSRMALRTCRNPECQNKPQKRKMYCSQECNNAYTYSRNLREEKYG